MRRALLHPTVRHHIGASNLKQESGGPFRSRVATAAAVSILVWRTTLGVGLQGSDIGARHE